MRNDELLEKRGRKLYLYSFAKIKVLNFVSGTYLWQQETQLGKDSGVDLFSNRKTKMLYKMNFYIVKIRKPKI